jgi:hypothetical protein
MNSRENPQNSVVVVALIMMGFICVVGLVFRQGPVQITPGPNMPGVTIDSPPPR